jgi:hypothetical protein
MILIMALVVMGVISSILLIILWIIFGSLIRNQFRRWRLAKKGFIEVEHISETNLREYMIMKPSDKTLDFFDGFFLYDSEAVTRGDKNVFKSYKREELEEAIYMKESDLESISDDKKKSKIKEIKALYKKYSKLKFDKEALTFKYGMPIISYYGDKPEPVTFRDLKRIYSSTFIKDMYIRLLLTQRYKDFKKFIIIGLIISGVVATCLLLIAFYLNGLTKELGLCQYMLNNTLSSYTSLVNQTNVIKSLSSSVVI